MIFNMHNSPKVAFNIYVLLQTPCNGLTVNSITGSVENVTKFLH